MSRSNSGVGFDPGAASQAFLRPHLARRATIYHARIYPGRHSSRYKGHRSAGTLVFVTATRSSFMSPSAEFLKHDNVSLGNMLNIKGTGSGVFELRIDCRGRYRTYFGRSRGLGVILLRG
jgi:hypothetical protein